MGMNNEPLEERYELMPFGRTESAKLFDEALKRVKTVAGKVEAVYFGYEELLRLFGMSVKEAAASSSVPAEEDKTEDEIEEIIDDFLQGSALVELSQTDVRMVYKLKLINEALYTRKSCLRVDMNGVFTDMYKRKNGIRRPA